jgi:hypothetical protein
MKGEAAMIAAALRMLFALEEARDFIADHVDVVDGSYGEPAPNRAMLLMQEIDDALTAANGALATKGAGHEKAP